MLRNYFHQYVIMASRRDLTVQLVVIGIFVFLGWGMFSTARTNLSELGMTSGFAFLERGTGWSYSFALFPARIEDTYARTLFIGFANTLFLGSISIILSTILGFIIGSIRDSSNIMVSAAASIFIQIFRNIPLILQVIFWYAVFIHMPGPRQSVSLLDSVFLSNRGLMIPTLNLSLTTSVLLLLGIILLAALLVWRRLPLLRGFAYWLLGSIALCVIASALFTPSGESILSLPSLQGLRFVGGIQVSVELLTMIVGILFYSSAYIAEVVRGGLSEVPRGYVEAGQSLGLRPFGVWSQIKLPIALRSIIPPLGNQWIFVMKATTVGIAIGFSDFFMIAATSINQSGNTLELIAILAGAFLVVNYTLARLVDLLNRRMAFKEH